MEHEHFSSDLELESQRTALINQIVDLRQALDSESDPHKHTVLKSAISKAEHQLEHLEEQMGVSKYKRAA